MITINFSDDIKHKYNSFNEILNLDNYNKITYLDCDNNNLPDQLSELPQETIKEYIEKCNEYYYNYNALKITNFFKNNILAQKRAVQILLAKSVENFYYSPDCKVMMKIREKQWQKHFK